ncbi:hypothetical protein KC221_30750, partial [Mycobacterium tuberculosis]|nr:hypothetical protein [Mycobacterium tuberculosis]
GPADVWRDFDVSAAQGQPRRLNTLFLYFLFHHLYLFFLFFFFNFPSFCSLYFFFFYSTWVAWWIRLALLRGHERRG